MSNRDELSKGGMQVDAYRYRGIRVNSEVNIMYLYWLVVHTTHV